MLVFDSTGQSPFLTTTDLNSSTAITAAYSDARTDTLYLAQGTNIVRYNSGTPLTYTWRSKVFRVSAPISMGVAAVEASAFPVTLKIIVDGQVKETASVASREPFRLGGGYRATEFQFEVIGNVEVRRLRMASSMQEIRSLA
jgi:hypothetical protein